MKRAIVFILSAVLMLSAIIAVRQTEKVNRVAEHISVSIDGNIRQLCSFYDDMYEEGLPGKYFESSLFYMDKICDSIKEEISFYYSLYPGRRLFLENITDDYKLILRMLRERDVTEELIDLHRQMHSYIIQYNAGADYRKNHAGTFYKKDKEIEGSDNGYELLHMKFVEKLHEK